MGLLEYSSNNSGGDWWLKDADWIALEDAGWTVEWCRNRKDSFFRPDKGGRWLGALATRAEKEFDSPEEGISEWESITGQTATDEGCNCCGPPHNFTFEQGGKTQYFSVTYGAISSGWS